MRLKQQLTLIILITILTLTGPAQAVTASQLADHDDSNTITKMRLPNEGRSDLQELIQRVDANVGEPSAEEPSSELEVDEPETVEAPVEDSGVSTTESKEAETTDDQKAAVKAKAPRASGSFMNGTSYCLFDSNTGILEIGYGELAQRIDQNLTAEGFAPTTVKSIKFDKLGTTFVTVKNGNIPYLFANLGQLSSFIDLSNFDTTNVTNMSYWFQNCKGLTNPDLSAMATASVTNMSYMFYGSGITNLNLNSWNVDKVTTFNHMFNGATDLTTLNLSKWGINRSATTVSMRSMFYNTSVLTSLNLTNFKTTNVTDMDSMFAGSGVASLDLGDWNVTKVTSFHGMFVSANKLTTLNVSGWGMGRIAAAVDMASMFFGTSALTNLNLTNFKTTNVTTMKQMFVGSGVTSLDLRDWDVTQVSDFSHMFTNCTKLNVLNLSNWDVGRVASSVVMDYLLSGTSDLTDLTLINFKTTNVTNMEYMFAGIGVTSLNLSDWDVTKVSNFDSMFLTASKLTTLNLSGWGMSRSATNVKMSSMFQNTTSLSNLIITNFNMQNVVNTAQMFYNTGLTTLDLSNWNTTSVTSCGNMFNNASNLWKVTLGNNVRFPSSPGFRAAPAIGTTINDSGQLYKTIAASWQRVGEGTDHNPKGDLVTTAQMWADTPRPVTFVWAQAPTFNSMSTLTFGTLGASDFFNGNSPVATNMSTGAVNLINLDSTTTYNITVAQTSDWSTNGQSATIGKSDLKIRYGANDLSTGASEFWSGISSGSQKPIRFNHNPSKNFSISLNPSAVINSALLGKQLESELTWTLSETP